MPVLALLLVSIVGYFAFRRVNRSAVETIQAKLTTILETAVKALTIWSEEHKNNATYVAQQAEVRAAVLELAAASRDGATAEELVAAAAQSKIRGIAKQACEVYGYFGYQVIDSEGTVLSDFNSGAIGMSTSPAYDEYRQKLLAGEPVLSRPFLEAPSIRDDRPIGYEKGSSEDAAGSRGASSEPQANTARPRMLAAAPIQDSSGKMVASIGFAMRPEGEFTQILSVARVGESGETLAFDQRGWMLSGSRFERRLRDKKMLAPSAATSVLNLRLEPPKAEFRDASAADRGASLAGPVSSATRLTALAESTLALRDGLANDTISSNLVGYKDYLGEQSIGAGTWLPEYGFGVITKVDFAEAFAPRIVLRNIFAVLASLAVIGVAGNFVYLARLNAAQRKIRQVEKKALTLGQYTLQEKIGEGGMGVVYRASHAMLRRPTAVKLLLPSRSSELAISRFEQEVQHTAQLTHPNTISIYDFGRTREGIFYYAMEYLDGLDLSRLTEIDGPQSPGRVIHILQQVCCSLKEAHQNHLIHQDIKPANVILCRRGGLSDVVKVLDFGLVRQMTKSAPDAGLTLKGTPAFMSPESIQSPDNVDLRTDIYAIGAMGYFLLTGKEVFVGKSVVEVLKQQLVGQPIPIAMRLGSKGRGTEKDESLENVLMKCLDKDRDLRPGSAEAVFDQLARCESAGKWTATDAEHWWTDYLATRQPETEPPQDLPGQAATETIIVRPGDLEGITRTL